VEGEHAARALREKVGERSRFAKHLRNGSTMVATVTDGGLDVKVYNISTMFEIIEIRDF
jgi:hypothetical protein